MLLLLMGAAAAVPRAKSRLVRCCMLGLLMGSGLLIGSHLSPLLLLLLVVVVAQLLLLLLLCLRHHPHHLLLQEAPACFPAEACKAVEFAGMAEAGG